MSTPRPALLPWLIVAALLLPVMPLCLWSVAHRWSFPDLLPEVWGLRAWRYLLAPRARLAAALWDSTLIGLAVTLLSLGIGLPAGRALGLHHFRGKGLVALLILAPTIVPTIAVAMGIQVAFIRLGLADTHAGVILAHLIPVTPYVTLILAALFTRFDPAYEAQARTLGATPWQVLRHVTLPMLRAGLLVAALFAFILSWSQYLLTLLVGGGQIITLPILLFTFANSGDYPLTAALSLCFVAPALLFALAAARTLGAGTVGGLVEIR